jgi:ribosomal protein L7/L12
MNIEQSLVLAKRNADYTEAEILRNLRWQFERLRDSSIRALEQIELGEHPSEVEGTVAFMEIQRGIVRLGELSERQGLIRFLEGQIDKSEDSSEDAAYINELCAVTPTRERGEIREIVGKARKLGKGINAVRLVRNKTGYGLKEAKDFVDRLVERR